jgi:hypothetical protein
MTARHAAAARLLGECPFPSAADLAATEWMPIGARVASQHRRDGWMHAKGTLAARLAGWRGRLACWLLGVRRGD